MQKITPFLWFDDKAEEAVDHYTSVFPDSRVIDVQRYGEAGPGEPGTVMTIAFELAGQRFTALNGGPEFTFTEAVSLYVDCADQAEVDSYWAKLGEGGEEGPCGWLKDKYGLSWQIIPTALMRMQADPDRERAGRAQQAMLQMRKIVIADLEAAFNG